MHIITVSDSVLFFLFYKQVVSPNSSSLMNWQLKLCDNYCVMSYYLYLKFQSLILSTLRVS